MRRRHPHLFDLGDAEPWEQIKRRERRGEVLGGSSHPAPAAQGVPAAGARRLRRLRLARRRRARWTRSARSWRRWSGSWNAGQRRDPTPGARRNEIGDLLFAVVNLARKAGVQPGPALDRANRKFRDRFEEVERLARERGIDLDAGGAGSAGRAVG